MNELLDSLRSLVPERSDSSSALWLAGIVAALGWTAVMGVRSLFPSDEPAETVDEADVDLVEEIKNRNVRPTLTQRFDQSFESLVSGTGLGLSSEQILGWIALAGVAGAVAIYVARPSLILAVVGMLIGVGATLVVLILYHGRRRWQMISELPDVVFSLARSTRAGLSIEQAVASVSRENKLLLAPEFRRAVAQMDLGMPAVVALDHMARRLRMIDLDGLVAVVGLHRTAGGNLPMLLERLALSARDRNQFRSYVRTATALGRTSAICIGMATPIILLGYAIVQPEYCFSFFQSTYGWTMVGVALTLDVVGGIWLYFLLRIEY